MKSSFTVKIVVWSCNLVLIILALSFLFGVYYTIKLPSLIAPNIDLEGVTNMNYRVSQSFLGDNYIFERIIDRVNNIDEENFYFTSTDNVYRVSFSDSLTMKASKINRDLSSSESRYFGLIQNSTIVTESTDDFPIRYAVPAVSLEKAVFVNYVRSNALSLLFVLLYGMVFIWYLRKFITGLLTPDFFTRNNAFYLKITAWMSIAAPLLMWLLSTFIRQDFFVDLKFDNASEVSSGFSLPLMMLFFGLVILVIAWSFDHSVKLQKEQELTI
ncbi:DUF2975 domain-containing protein [Rhodohalobacter sp.]|uniref:DUF2975 domain-containing protein n=1 Tax=Rhodohalobacter sp. TaxID=1974210 RepID=UPI003562C55D